MTDTDKAIIKFTLKYYLLPSVLLTLISFIAGVLIIFVKFYF